MFESIFSNPFETTVPAHSSPISSPPGSPVKKDRPSLLDDFASGNTTLDDIIALPPPVMAPADNLFANTADLFDFDSYLRSFSLESQFFGSSKTDLDFSHVQKTTVDDLDSMISNLSIDEIDAQVRSAPDVYEHDDIGDMDFGAELNKFLRANDNQFVMDMHHDDFQLEFDDNEPGNSPTQKQNSPLRICSPSTHTIQKPSIKPCRNLLNLIVESSDGSIEDATKYATEINAQNCLGIPIPEKTTELVTIPTAGPPVDGVRKAAIVKAILARTTALRRPEKSAKRVGFYTESERQSFLQTRNGHKRHNKNSSLNNQRTIDLLKEDLQENQENIRPNRPAHKLLNYSDRNRKRVSWANSLEW
ncbi:hypothetical protein OGAPHI_003810 [Ogataea philodendri]|uniref:Uncharacterized protein n=1 Tax=Ogataea philodendri TaxID=1378263 RepID=A0A9P8P644_9ASCO|nr:uncharacterized protein OGAPHI_003810 [Ogataea philodendri]KAH3665622.1 hypothetical protein OGAPHI_003810 [Ogataea philodendri]